MRLKQKIQPEPA